MLKLKHVVTGTLLALIACGPAAHAEPHGGGGFHGGGGGRGGGGWHGGGGRGYGGGWHDEGRGGGRWRGGGWGWGGWGGGYYPYYPVYGGWGYPWGEWGWGGGWGWGWGGYAMAPAMGAAAAGASYQAAPEIYNGTGNNAPEDDSVYDKDLSTLVTDQTAPPRQGQQPASGQAAPASRPVTCPRGQVYNTLTESCDRP
ncbi:hypothetical protein [Komagataeibacter europaeus]|nr:hypothetical protein [Komagataeibacter europaeus]